MSKECITTKQCERRQPILTTVIKHVGPIPGGPDFLHQVLNLDTLTLKLSSGKPEVISDLACDSLEGNQMSLKTEIPISHPRAVNMLILLL